LTATTGEKFNADFNEEQMNNIDGSEDEQDNDEPIS
jgi:hypothetical protein